MVLKFVNILSLIRIVREESNLFFCELIHIEVVFNGFINFTGQNNSIDLAEDSRNTITITSVTDLIFGILDQIICDANSSCELLS